MLIRLLMIKMKQILFSKLINLIGIMCLLSFNKLLKLSFLIWISLLFISKKHLLIINNNFNPFQDNKSHSKKPQYKIILN